MSETVLIVDEDVNAQIIAETLLRAHGLSVRVATASAEATGILDREDVGVVVLDLSMTATHGTEIVRWFRQRSRAPWMEAAPHLLVVSDHDEPEIGRFAERLGAAAFLRKPLEPGRFIATVEGLLSRTRVMAAIGDGWGS